jgi:hypothetical protein
VTLASPLRLPLLVALLGLQLAAQAAPKAPVAVSFDTTPRAGQHQRQLIDLQAVMKMRMEAGPDATDEQRAKIADAAAKMSQMGAMKMAMQMQQEMQVYQADADGWLPLTMSMEVKDGKLDVGGNSVPLPNNRAMNVSFGARFNPKDFAFEVKKLEGMPAEQSAAMITQGTSMISESLQLYKALSQRPLKVGESVEVPMTMALPMPLPGGAGGMQGVVRYTLTRVDKGVAYFDLDMDMKMNMTVPLPSQPVAANAAASAASVDSASSAAPAAVPPQTLHMVITGNGKGTSSLRLADRLQLASRLAMDMKMTMNGPDNGRMLMDMDMNVQTKGESLAKPAAAKAPAKKKP